MCSFHFGVYSFDATRLGTSIPARVFAKKIRVKPIKEPKLATNKHRGTFQGPRLVHDKLANLRGDDAGSVKSPTETSSSEEESSSDDESEYEEDEDMPVKDIREVGFFSPHRP